MRNVVGNLSKPKDTACFHVFCENLGKNLVIMPCPGVSLPKKHHVSPHFPLRKPCILRSVSQHLIGDLVFSTCFYPVLTVTLLHRYTSSNLQTVIL